MITKICSKCKESKETINFYTNKSSKSGYNSWCKQCCSNCSKLLYNKTKPPMKDRKQLFIDRNNKIEELGVLQCTRCKETKELSDFSIRNDSRTRYKKYSSRCNACKVLTSAEKYKTPEGNARYMRSYNKKRNQIKTPLQENIQNCYSCNIEQALKYFSKSEIYSTGLLPICKQCMSDRAKAHRKTEVGVRTKRKYYLKTTYNITVEEYTDLLEFQHIVCAICDVFVPNPRHQTSLYLDHCHITGKLRGFLCHKCNSAIGYLNDNLDLLRSAVKYLENPPYEQLTNADYYEESLFS